MITWISRLSLALAFTVFGTVASAQNIPANRVCGTNSTTGVGLGICMIFYSGNPETNVVGAPGSIVVSDNGSTYQKAAGSGTDTTGWIALGSSGSSGAPTGATYITQTADGTLSAEQVLSALPTGLMKVTTGTGAITVITDSAGLAAALNNETGGSGFAVFSGAPTIATPIFTGAVSWPNNVRQEFSPGTSVPGLNVGTALFEPSSILNGDIYYNSGPGRFLVGANSGRRQLSTTFDAADYCADAGSTDSYVCSLGNTIGVTNYVVGAAYLFRANTANTADAEVDFNGFGATQIVKAIGGLSSPLNTGDIRAGQIVELVYDGTYMQMVSPGASEDTYLVGSLGDEMATNPLFTGAATGWTLGAGWTYGGDAVTHSSGTATLSQNIADVAGVLYKVVITDTGGTTGEVVVSISGGNSELIAADDSPDTYNFYLIAGGNTGLVLTPTTDYDGTITSISVKEAPDIFNTLGEGRTAPEGIHITGDGRLGITDTRAQFLNTDYSVNPQEGFRISQADDGAGVLDADGAVMRLAPDGVGTWPIMWLGPDPDGESPRNAYLQLLATDRAPASGEMWPLQTSLTTCHGDNATLRGCGGLFIVVQDDATVDSSNKGLLYGISINVNPLVDRNNTPYDDAAGLVITNAGDSKATDAVFVSRNSGIAGSEYAAVFSSAANADYGLLLAGVHVFADIVGDDGNGGSLTLQTTVANSTGDSIVLQGGNNGATTFATFLAASATFSGYLAGVEVSEPAAPAANGWRIFAEDSGGKTRLCARFASGISQCFATEP